MNKLWPYVTKENPCPICGKPDWCQFGDRAVKCMRIESAAFCPSGGWYHFYGEATRLRCGPVDPPRETNTLAIDPSRMIAEWQARTLFAQQVALANSLGVLVESLLALGACWAKPHRAWAFPMRDGDGKIVGVRLRNIEGKKWAVSGSRQGVFVPLRVPAQRRAYICEGPTDAAAALSIGLYTIGRPSCCAGDDIVKQTLRRLVNVKEIVIVTDNDRRELKGKEVSPGFQGAIKLQRSLGRRSCIWAPPAKDIRDFVNNGGTKAEVEASVNSMIWK